MRNPSGASLIASRGVARENWSAALQESVCLAAGAEAGAVRGRGMEEIFIVDRRREIVETQVKQEMFNWRDDVLSASSASKEEHEKSFLTFADETRVFVAG